MRWLKYFGKEIIELYENITCYMKIFERTKKEILTNNFYDVYYLS